MKKEYLILTALILLLSGYLFLHKENKDHYTLPEIQEIDTKTVTKISVQRNNNIIEFNKKGDAWTVTDKKYPADSSLIINMLDTFKNFKLTALVSEKSDLERYELDKAHAIEVKISNESKPLFQFTMGKTAPSFNHTFVMLSGDKNVYHANGSFRNDFNQESEDYRDTKVLEVKQEAVSSITIKKGDIQKTILSQTSQNDDAKAQPKWQNKDETPVDAAKISELLSSLSFVKCKDYPQDISKEELKTKTPACYLEIAAQEQINFSLYSMEDKKELSGISSMNSYVFTLSEFDSKEILDKIDGVLGITSEKK